MRASTVTLAEAEKAVLDYVTSHIPQAGTAPLCGNSIATDRSFLARDMPALDEYLHYRMIDVSSLKELARRWYPRVYWAQPAKGLAHRALADIHESIQELAYYRQAPVRRAARARPARKRPRSPKPFWTLRERPARLIRRCGRPLASPVMVGVAQLVEHRVVVPGVAGSSPVTHPNYSNRRPDGPR